MTSRTRALAAAAALSFLLTACNAGSSSDDPTDADDATGGQQTAAPAGDATVRIGLVAEPASLDFTTTDGAAIPRDRPTNATRRSAKSNKPAHRAASQATDRTVA